MEFDLSKENIQPLRGGRNVTQLEVALQAQSDAELQRELVQQKEAFEEAIRTYEGDDPLDNWYNYISWLEQSYPKHGHEGNLTPVLEECLAKFENDERYIHDRRFCKLWIKYIDLQQDPLELFQLLHSKGICVSCADLYRAWAFYHEVAEDYKRADLVFNLGLRVLAQPYEELVLAHENMFAALGRQAVQGVDERRLVEQRHALTTLRTYKHKHRATVPSVRTGNHVVSNTPGVLQSISRQGRSGNVPISFYEDQGAVGVPTNISILEVARNQETVKKENTLKPGPWSMKRTGALVTQHRTHSFKVHEDEEPKLSEGIRLPPNHAPMNHDDFSTWVVELCFPEPPDASKIPMYPKHLVYCGETTEYSPEEIRARKWFAKRVPMPTDTSVNMQETISEEANIITSAASIVRHSIAPTMLYQDNSGYNAQSLSYFQRPSNAFASSSQEEVQAQISSCNYSEQFPSTSNASQTYLRKTMNSSQVYRESMSNMNPPGADYMRDMRRSYLPMSGNTSHEHYSGLQPTEQVHQQWVPEQHIYHDSGSTLVPQPAGHNSPISKQHSKSIHQPQPWVEPIVEKKVTTPPHPISSSIINPDNNCTVMKDVNELWKDNLTTLQESTVEIPKQPVQKFQIHEDTEIIREEVDRDVQYRKSIAPQQTDIHKLTTPAHFNIYQDDDNACKDVPHRKSIISSEKLRTPFACQPSAEKFTQKALFGEGNFLHPSEVKKPAFTILEDNPPKSAFDETCTTQTFNFNLNTIKVSTPFNYKKQVLHQYANASIFDEPTDTLKPQPKKVLFDENASEDKHEQWNTLQEEHHPPQDKLSVILETSKEYRSSSSSSSSGITLKTTTFNLKTIAEVSVTEANSIVSESHAKPDCHSTSKASNEFIRFSTSPRQLHHEHIYNEAKENSNVKHIESHCISTKEPNRISTVQTDLEVQKTYSDIANLLCSDSPDESSDMGLVPNISMKDDYQLPKSNFFDQPNNVIDLTEGDESIMMRKNEHLAQVSSEAQHQKSIQKAFESPVKNHFKDNFESSNDSLSSSPMKGHRMEVDTNFLSQNSNSEFRMDCDSYQEAPVSMGTPILQRPPSDPFSTEVQNALLEKIGFPGIKHLKTVLRVQTFPKMSGKKEIVQIADRRYMVEKVLGKGAFGCVYKATDLNTDDKVALKYQKPPNKWEFYICKEIQARVTNPHMLHAYMDITYCFYNNNGSILVSDLCKYGSLLDVANKVKQVTGKGMKELVAIYYANEIFTIVNTLHQCQIIHADIKPDNFLVTRMPPEYGHPSLKLIDFGCSIDMSLFPKGTTFTKVVSTEDFICTEMKDGRPWTYQTDIFCIAATIHVLLFEKYMQLQKRGDVWCISEKIPRYMRVDFWNTFFYDLLNIESCDKLPDLNLFKGSLESILSSQVEQLQIDLRNVANTVTGK